MPVISSIETVRWHSRASCGKEAPFRRRRDPGRWSCSWNPNNEPPPAYLCLKPSKIPADGKKTPEEPIDGTPVTRCTAQNAWKIPFRLKQLHLPKSHRGSWVKVNNCSS